MELKAEAQRRLNAEKSFVLVSAFFPNEKWINTEPNIYVAKSRMVEKYREPRK